MIVNIRGAGGSGKSTIVRAFMDGYAERYPKMVPRRRKPLSYLLVNEGRRGVSVLGQYEIPCGGCDTLDDYEQTFALARQHHTMGLHVLMEGVMLSDDTRYLLALNEWTGGQVRCVFLNTPLDVCLDRLNHRRRERGLDRPVDPASTTRRYKLSRWYLRKLAGLGMWVEDMDCAAALVRTRELLY